MYLIAGFPGFAEAALMIAVAVPAAVLGGSVSYEVGRTLGP